jgi:hypothetical protein
VTELEKLREFADATDVDEFAPESTDTFTTTEEETEVPTLERSEGGSEAIEQQRVVDVTSSDPAELDHYLDGRQRTFIAGYIEDRRHDAFLPIHLHHSGAVTVTADRDLHDGPRTWLKILVPKIDRLPPRMRRRLKNGDMEVIETLEGRGPENDYQRLRKIGVERSSNHRDLLEQELVRDHGEETLIAKDGTIPEPAEFVVERNNIVGIVKNHYKRYLDFEDDRVMFNMDVGERTWLFKTERSGNTLYSCYLRIRQVAENPRVGVVRVEIHPDREHEIDQICSRLTDEAYPLQRNIPSWESQVYPFYVAEKAIDAHMLGRETVLSSLKGLGVII